MPTWRVGGYLLRIYSHDHPPLHVHVFKDGHLVAKYDLEGLAFMKLRAPRQQASILRALRRAGLIGERA